MALEISYSPQFFDRFVERFGIEYQIRDNAVLIIDIYSCETDPDIRTFKKQ